VALPKGTPTWPEFTTENNQFLELNSKNIQVITTPNKVRLDKLKVLQKARKVQKDADLRPQNAGKCCRYTMIQFLAVIYFYETLIISFLIIECLDVQ